jgi:hypothetical protein
MIFADLYEQVFCDLKFVSWEASFLHIFYFKIPQNFENSNSNWSVFLLNPTGLSIFVKTDRFSTSPPWFLGRRPSLGSVDLRCPRYGALSLVRRLTPRPLLPRSGTRGRQDRRLGGSGGACFSLQLHRADEVLFHHAPPSLLSRHWRARPGRWWCAVIGLLAGLPQGGFEPSAEDCYFAVR